MSLPYDIRRCAQVRLWILESSSASSTSSSSVPCNALWRLDCFIGGRTSNMHDGVWEPATRRLLLSKTNAFFSAQACIHLFVQHPTRLHSTKIQRIWTYTFQENCNLRLRNFSPIQKQKKVFCLYFFLASPWSRIFATIFHSSTYKTHFSTEFSRSIFNSTGFPRLVRLYLLYCVSADHHKTEWHILRRQVAIHNNNVHTRTSPRTIRMGRRARK